MLKVVHDVEASNEPAGGSLLDEIVRDGARQMLAAALQAESPPTSSSSRTSSTSTVGGWWSVMASMPSGR
jgi:hypothetical protein